MLNIGIKKNPDGKWVHDTCPEVPRGTPVRRQPPSAHALSILTTKSKFAFDNQTDNEFGSSQDTLMSTYSMASSSSSSCSNDRLTPNTDRNDSRRYNSDSTPSKVQQADEDENED